MIKQLRLEDLIRDKIPLGSADSRGFYSLKCQHCNDYKVRAGFKFDNGTVGYNCWNCGATSIFKEMSGEITKKFRNILTSYGIEDSEISNVVNSAFFVEKKEEKITLASLAKIDTTTPAISLPNKSIRLGSTEDFSDYQAKIASYLIERKIDIMKYPFFFSLEKRMLNRVIIPFYRQGKLIFWQARSIDKNEKKRYDNAISPKEAVMYNMDKLNTYSPLPLFITEGVFDAMMFDGVAILGSKLNAAKIDLLKKSNRRKVFVIDKDKNGKALAEHVTSLGWDIAFTPNGADDLNKSVQRFGFAWTALEVARSIPVGPDAVRLAISMNCK